MVTAGGAHRAETNLDRLQAAQAAVGESPFDHNNDSMFVEHFVGSLSVLVDRDDWDRALKSATDGVVADRARRACTEVPA